MSYLVSCVVGRLFVFKCRNVATRMHNSCGWNNYGTVYKSVKSTILLTSDEITVIDGRFTQPIVNPNPRVTYGEVITDFSDHYRHSLLDKSETKVRRTVHKDVYDHKLLHETTLFKFTSQARPLAHNL